MNIGVLGTGLVGRTIATRLVGLGHQVTMGSRTPDNEHAVTWAADMGGNASCGTFADAAIAGELLFNCTAGRASVDALVSAGVEHLSGKILIDLANPLDFSKGMPPTLWVCDTDSLGEQIQRAFPDVRVVKTLNTMNCEIMIEPARVPGDHDVFLSGDDEDAKLQVKQLLGSFGWGEGQIVDLGDITTCRGPEMYLALWVRLLGALETRDFNIKVVR